MPTINPSLVPTKAPGTIFSSLTGGDATLNVRWLTTADPAYAGTINRPMADITVRQLVIAKALDALSLSMGHQILFPFVIQPIVVSGSTAVDLPPGWIWDLHGSIPKKWEQLRLAKIKRISGLNSTTDGYSGTLRLIFTANVQNSSTEVALFYADYEIDSNLTYQRIRLLAVEADEEAVVIDSGEQETIAGFILFRTLDTEDSVVQSFLDLVDAPADKTDSNSDGIYDNPAIYELSDTVAGGIAVTDDFLTTSLSHGTGLLTDSAWNAIPELDSDIQSWISTFNYPFDSAASRTSVDSIEIPSGLFREFDITAPAGDQPTGDTTGTMYPVWVNRIERIGTGSNQLRFYFATFNVTDTDSGGDPSLETVEFATLDLLRSYSSNEIVAISPNDNLQLITGSDAEAANQHFGRGHVVLSSVWDRTTSEIDDFFDAFESIVDSPPDTTFTQAATRISSFGISRVPKYIPTIGQSRALIGSTERRTVPVRPSYDNRYVCELDQGIGNQVDLESQTGITAHTSIERYGYTGGLVRQCIKLVVNASSFSADSDFYDSYLLPRIRILLGRDPQFGDVWFNGTRFLTFNGDTWQD